jgi:chromosome segregation ATPase
MFSFSLRLAFESQQLREMGERLTKLQSAIAADEASLQKLEMEKKQNLAETDAIQNTINGLREELAKTRETYDVKVEAVGKLRKEVSRINKDIDRIMKEIGLKVTRPASRIDTQGGDSFD